MNLSERLSVRRGDPVPVERSTEVGAASRPVLTAPTPAPAAAAPAAPQPRTVVPANDTIDLPLAGRIAAGTQVLRNVSARSVAWRIGSTFDSLAARIRSPTKSCRGC